uniref:Uncharacterized protein n=1 Tax=Meloidogyne enterolobii TaxID=390850 RepID=A0A6V7UMC7_MELEN|nr:unnamed protein product [Meloidogyne enterolobii]
MRLNLFFLAILFALMAQSLLFINAKKTEILVSNDQLFGAHARKQLEKMKRPEPLSHH